MIADIFDELKKQFNLKKNHIIILKLLSAEDCTADEICERTTIPKGRVYNLLNELINMRLIVREKGVPAVYSMKNPEDRVLDFLRYDFNREVEKQNRLLSLLQEKSKADRLDLITNNVEYDYNLVALMSRAQFLKTIHRHLSISWFIQPRDEQEFWELRQEINRKRRAATTPAKEISILKYRTYMKLYREKPVEQIMTKEALDMYVSIYTEMYGKEKLSAWAKEILEDLEKQKNVRLYILDTISSVFNTYISDKEVLSIVIFRGEVSGIDVMGERVADLYNKAFEEMKSRAQPLQKYLSELL